MIDVFVNHPSRPRTQLQSVPTEIPADTANKMICAWLSTAAAGDRDATQNLEACPRTQLQSVPAEIPADTANKTICAWLGTAAAGDRDATQNLEALHTHYLKVCDADMILIMPCI
jgi:hypothetical protein